MPLVHGSSQATVRANIRELHKGKTYAHTKGKFGKKRADRQAVAIALDEARSSDGRKKYKHDSTNWIAEAGAGRRERRGNERG